MVKVLVKFSLLHFFHETKSWMTFPNSRKTGRRCAIIVRRRKKTKNHCINRHLKKKNVSEIIVWQWTLDNGRNKWEGKRKGKIMIAAAIKSFWYKRITCATDFTANYLSQFQLFWKSTFVKRSSKEKPIDGEQRAACKQIKCKFINRINQRPAR